MLYLQLAGFPPKSTLLQAIPWGASAWTKTAKIVINLHDGTAQAYFLKISSENVAPIMMEGEFNSIKTIHSLMPEFAPKPFGWGEYKSSPGTYFVLMEFLDIVVELPDPGTFCHLVSQLHKGKSPTNRFGFHVPTCHGKIPQPNTWDSSWSHYFTGLVKVFHKWDVETNGTWPEYELAFETLVSTVIPRLLEPLQADGRDIKPTLVHGDLWEENVGINTETGEPIIYDPAVFYAHHEYELGMWRREIIAFDQAYVKQYLLRNPPSEPAEQWDDRNRLYSIKFNISHSAHWEGMANITRPM